MGENVTGQLVSVEWDWLLSLVIGSFVFAGYQLHKFLNDASTLPIEAVAIKGERTYTR